VVEITSFKEDITVKHFDRPGLEGFIYNNIFSPSLFQSIKSSVNSILHRPDTKTYLTHGTTFKIEDQHKKIISHAQNARYQVVLFDLTFLKGWYHQTPNTIKKWSTDTLKTTISPVFYKCIETIENLEPLSNDKESWIFYRLHFNYLDTLNYLTLHLDSAPNITKHIEGYIDHRGARMYSLTTYLYDHVEGFGGELWTPYGFVYKPKANSAILLNGHQALHGVTQNIDNKPRLAFTIRLVHKDDLFLPGSPDKFLYDVSTNL